ncbi:MAG: SigE family RNA polymerase sigma factor [Actinomycetes bacterium]
MDGALPSDPVVRSGATEPAIAVDREQLVLGLYRSHYGQMERLAFLLLGGSEAAEDVAQEAFIRVYYARGRLRDPNKAVDYLRSTVVNLARGRLRRRLVALRHAPRAAPEPDGPEERALAALRAKAVVRALASLPARQREVLVLRYYDDLSEAQAAEALGISIAAVKSAAFRGTAALAVLLEEQQ